MFDKPNRFQARRTLAAAMISAVFAATATADETPAPATPPVLFSAPLADVPGKQLVVVELRIPPKADSESEAAPRSRAHRHPGSVYVHVTEGALRLGLEGEPVQVVREGGSFFEPAGALHTVIENVSSSEPARAIAVMIVPEGAPLVTADSDEQP